MSVTVTTAEEVGRALRRALRLRAASAREVRRVVETLDRAALGLRFSSAQTGIAEDAAAGSLLADLAEALKG